MKDSEMLVSDAVKLLYEKGKRRCYSCGKKFRKADEFGIVPNDARNKNFIADGKMLCGRCYRCRGEKMKKAITKAKLRKLFESVLDSKNSIFLEELLNKFNQEFEKYLGFKMSEFSIDL